MKVLFFSHDGKLGDAIVNTAFVAGVRALAPHAQIDVLASSASMDFWRKHRDIRKVWKFQNPPLGECLKTSWAIRQERFDYLVTFKKRFRSEKTRLLLALAKPAKGFIAEEGRRDGRVQHAVHKSRDSLDAIFGPAASALPLNYQLGFDVAPANDLDSNPAARSDIVLVNLFAAEPHRTVKTDVAAQLLQELAAAMPQVELSLLCTPDTLAQAQAAQAQSGVACSIVDTKMDFMRLIAVCARADLIISPDTSLVHIASALGKPVLGIFQDDGIKSIEWAPRSGRSEIVIAPSKDSIHGFSVDEVVRKTLRLRAA